MRSSWSTLQAHVCAYPLLQEMWAGRKCAASYFRQRLWGTLSMFKLFVLDKECWISHMELEGPEGDDPDGVRIRAAQGFEAADYCGACAPRAGLSCCPRMLMPSCACADVGGYWVWALLIESLADVGYSPNNMHVASYDWRLPYAKMELRDQYFTRLRYQIEMLVTMHGEKVAIVAHSMGANVVQYFMQWISSPHGGKLSSAWVHEHVSQVIAIGPPWLGCPKVVTGMLMGESRDFTYLTGALGGLVYVAAPESSSGLTTWPSSHGPSPRAPRLPFAPQ